MAVNLLLILLFETEDDLRRDNSFIGVFESKVGVQCERGRIFEKMGSNRHVGAVGKLDILFHHPVLVDSEKG